MSLSCILLSALDLLVWKCRVVLCGFFWGYKPPFWFFFSPHDCLKPELFNSSALVNPLWNLSPHYLRRLLARSGYSWWGVSALCGCRRSAAEPIFPELWADVICYRSTDFLSVSWRTSGLARTQSSLSCGEIFSFQGAFAQEVLNYYLGCGWRDFLSLHSIGLENLHFTTSSQKFSDFFNLFCDVLLWATHSSCDFLLSQVFAHHDINDLYVIRGQLPDLPNEVGRIEKLNPFF